MNAKSKKSLLVFALLSLLSSFVCAKQSEQGEDLGDLLLEKGLVSQDELDGLRNKSVNAKKSIQLRGDARVQYIGNFAKEPDLPADEADVQTQAKFRVQAFALRSIWDLGSGFSAHFDIGLSGDEARGGIVRGVRVLTAYGRYNHSEYLTVDVGFKGVPFGYEEGLSSSELKTLGHTPANAFFDGTLDLGNRYTGLFAHGNVVEGLYYKAAVTNSLADDLRGNARGGVDKITSSRKPAFWGQLGYEDKFESIGYDFGGSIAYVPNQKLPTDDPAFDSYQFGWNLFARAQWESLDILADFYASRVHDAINLGETEMPYGFSIIPSYKITDSVELVGAVSYINAKQVPGSRFGGAEGTALINPAKVLDNADAGGTYFNKMIAWYGGVNYYFSDSVKLTAGYQYSQFKGRDLENIQTDTAKRRHHSIGAQLQMTF